MISRGFREMSGVSKAGRLVREGGVLRFLYSEDRLGLEVSGYFG